jgi:HTH-type transcriptional regulator, sugar sensing transcriptional regulator
MPGSATDVVQSSEDVLTGAAYWSEDVVQDRENIMDVAPVLELLGLSKTEAKVYWLLLGEPPLPAATIADLTRTSRSSVYLVLRSLADKGLVEAGAGYSSRYHAAPPQQALPALLERERAELRTREQHVDQVLPQLSERFDNSTGEDGEILELLRTPRVVGERFDRLQSEARHTIDIVVRGPIQVGGVNEAETAALRRGVRTRAIYDRSVLTDPSVTRHLDAWTAQGEQARWYANDLPMKFAVFDSHTVLMPLVSPTVQGVAAIVVRHRELAAGLEFLFATLWAEAEPLDAYPASISEDT